MSSPAPVLARVLRDGHVESLHTGDLAVCDVTGAVLTGAGDPQRAVYVRSSIKPFQTLASTELLAGAGIHLDERGLAIASASHSGSAEHQIEAGRLLAEAGLDERALRCPPDLPVDLPTLRRQDRPERLAHNCSGKHAAFLYAHTATGGDPSCYLEPAAPLQQHVVGALERLLGASPGGPGTDGCGAPAWILPVAALATGFARLAAGVDGDGVTNVRLAAVRDAMTAHPHLAGHAEAADTLLMLAVDGLVAKRGAEGVLAAGWPVGDRVLGAAVKITDGAARAAAVVLAAAVARSGAAVPDRLLRPPVLGGGVPHGRVEATGIGR